jgi:hypothetical protein
VVVLVAGNGEACRLGSDLKDSVGDIAVAFAAIRRTYSIKTIGNFVKSLVIQDLFLQRISRLFAGSSLVSACITPYHSSHAQRQIACAHGPCRVLIRDMSRTDTLPAMSVREGM